ARLRLLYGRAAALQTLPEFNRPEHQSGDHGQNDQNSENCQQSGAAPSWGGGRPAEQPSQQAINEFLYSSGPTPYHRFALLLGLVFRTGEDVIKPRALILRCQVLSGLSFFYALFEPGQASGNCAEHRTALFNIGARVLDDVIQGFVQPGVVDANN